MSDDFPAATARGWNLECHSTDTRKASRRLGDVALALGNDLLPNGVGLEAYGPDQPVD